MSELSRAEVRDLFETIKDMKRQIRDLENRPIGGQVLPGQYILVVDSDLDKVCRIGKLPDGNDGLVVWDATPPGLGDTILNVDAVNGFRSPWLATPWAKANDFISINSAGFTSTYVCRVELIKSTQIRFAVTISTDAATTGTARVNIGGTTWDKSLSTGGTIYDLEFIATHGKDLHTGPFIVDLQVRRDTGAGNLNVYNPSGVHAGADMPLPATGWL